MDGFILTLSKFGLNITQVSGFVSINAHSTVKSSKLDLILVACGGAIGGAGKFLCCIHVLHFVIGAKWGFNTGNLRLCICNQPGTGEGTDFASVISCATLDLEAEWTSIMVQILAEIAPLFCQTSCIDATLSDNGKTVGFMIRRRYYHEVSTSTNFSSSGLEIAVK